MAHLLRAKQSGIQGDLSVNITPSHFCLDDLRRYGVASQITTLAYDPVQSLIAIGTRSSQFGPGCIYIFGGQRTQCVFSLPSTASASRGRGADVKQLQFCSDKLLGLDSRNDFSVFSLVERKCVTRYSPPGQVMCFTSDPTLDFCFIGMQNGEVLAYDIDREGLAPLKLPCFWQEQNPRVRVTPVVALQLHPRDVGTLLIGYAEGAVIYSFKQNKPTRYFTYHLQMGAPGGDGDPVKMNMARNPKLTQAVWHPTGTFIVTAHEDSSLVIWDLKDGRIIQARSLTNTNVDRPGPSAPQFASARFIPIAPILKVAWCANQDPDDTGIMLSGGMAMDNPARGLTFYELGRTPPYATSSWQILSEHFETPKRSRLLPTPPKANVVDFCLIPRKTPWYNGCHDPIAVLALLSSGELTTLSFPSGYLISPTNQLHLSLTFVHPFITYISHCSVERNRWLGLTENRSSGPKILRGGSETTRPLKRFEDRSILQTAHADGTVRLWDSGHGDEIENEMLIQADVCRAVGRVENVQVSRISFSGASGEMAVGLQSGEITIFKWNRNSRAGQEPPPAKEVKPKSLTNVSDRKDPSLIEGFHPFTLLDQQDGHCTALKVSDVGFIAAGFEGGSLVLIDMRGPAIIYSVKLSDVLQKDKGKLLRRQSGSSGAQHITTLEFSVMTVENDSYSSILLHAGTITGHVATFKILPGQGGRFSAAFAGASTGDGRVINIMPLNTSTGKVAEASPQAVGGLREGFKVDGVLLCVTKIEARIFKPASGKGVTKNWDSGSCESATLTHCHDEGQALVAIFDDGTARTFTLPALREFGSIRVDNVLDRARLSDAIITPAGDVISWKGPSELAMLNVWGVGANTSLVADKIFSSEALIPPRPTISNLEWVSGTQYMTPAQMDILIGGPNRPLSKRQIEASRAEEVAKRAGNRGQRSPPAEASSQETWGAYMTRQINERTEALGLAGDRMDKLEDNSASWSDEVGKFVSEQKRSLAFGAIKRGLF